MRSLLVPAGLAAALLLAAPGCGSSDGDVASTGSTTTTKASTSTTTAASGAVELAGTNWVLASYTAGAEKNDTPAGVATLTFADGGELSGSTGCNRLAGTYEVDGDALTITLGPATLMACEDEALNAQEQAIVNGLPEVTTFTATEDSLTLLGFDEQALFTYDAADGLEGAWSVTGVNNGKDAVQGSSLTEALTADFGPDGTFSGYGGCNTLSGPYETTDPDGLTIGPLAGTMMACAEDVMALEAQYQAALAAVATYTIDGDTLTLRDADGATQITAARATEESVPAGE